MNIDQIGEAFLEFAASEIVNPDQPVHLQRKRTAGAMSQYRHAVRSFCECVKQSGKNLSELPENFLQTAWVKSQSCAAIQLRQRGYALKHFVGWLQKNNYPVPPLAPVIVNIPKGPPKPPKPSMGPPPVAEESYMEENMEAAAEAPEAPVYTPEVLPAEPPVAAPPPPAPRPMIPPPPSAPQPAPVMQPPPGAKLPTYTARAAKRAGAAPAPAQPVAQVVADPLATMFPSNTHKLRVRRERDLDEPAWIGDYNADQVKSYGAIEPFLAKLLPRVAPTLPAGTTEVTFLVSSVGPYGEGDRARFTLAVPVGMNAGQQPAAAQPVAAQTFNPGTNMDPYEAMNLHRRVLEDLEGRIAERVVPQPQQPPSPAPTPQPAAGQLGGIPQPLPAPTHAPAGMPDLPPGIMSLIGRLVDKVDELNTRVQEREQQPIYQPAPQQPQIDVLGLIKAVHGLMPQPQQQVQQQPQQSPMDMLALMERMQNLTRPSAVNIDVSPLEERIHDLQEKLEKQSRKSEIEEFASKMESLQRIFGGNPLMGANQRPTRSFGETLAEIVGQVVQNAPTIADSVERVVAATAQAKAEVVRAAVRERVNAAAALRQQQVQQPETPAPAPEPEPERVTRPPVTPRDRPNPKLKREVVAAIQKALAAKAETPKKAIWESVNDLMVALADSPDTKDITSKVETFILSGEFDRLKFFLGEVLRKLGFEASAAQDKIVFIVDSVIAHLMDEGTISNPHAEEDEEEEEEPEIPTGTGPEVNVVVGGGDESGAPEEGGDEAEEDEDAADEDEDEDAEEAEAV